MLPGKRIVVVKVVVEAESSKRKYLCADVSHIAGSKGQPGKPGERLICEGNAE